MRNYLTDEEIKHELLTMLKDISSFLDSRELIYSISSGTLLGAVRHGGFIPWDDDIDLLMPRNDYNIFIEILKKEKKLCKKYMGIGFELENGIIPFIKIANPTIKVEEANGTGSVEKNLWIDIFPVDGLPKRNIKFYDYFTLKLLRKIYFYKRESFENIEYNRKGIKKITAEIVKTILKSINFKKFIRFYIKQCEKFPIDNSLFVRDTTWGTKIFPKKCLEEFTYYNFEDVEVKGFKDYDLYLTYLYGDYLKEPAEDKRVNHGIKAWREMTNEE